VQVVFWEVSSVAGAQLIPDNCAGATKFNVKLSVTPLAEAVITAVSSLVTAATVAVNPALPAPAGTVRLPGTVTLALLSASATAKPPLAAGLFNETVQLEDPGALTLAGVHVTAVSVTGTLRFTVAVRLCPFQSAVTVAAWSALTVPAVAVNVPLLDPALIVRLAGTLNTLRLLDRLIVRGLVAAFVRVMVQVVFWEVSNVVGAQLIPDNCAGATKFNVKLSDTPFAETVITAVSSIVTAATVAVNPALPAPAGTVTLPGTVTLALLSASATAKPPLAAGLFNETVQLDDPGALTVAGAHVTPLNVTGTLRFTVAVRLCPFQSAVTVAAWSALTVPAVAVNVPLLDPALIVRLAGTLNTLRLLDRLIVRGLVAAFVRVMVQVVFWEVSNVVGVQLIPDNCAGATKFNVKLSDTPFAEAVITAVSSLVTAATVAVNPALLAPTGTVTLPGTTTLGLLSPSETTKPPAGASPLRATVQEEEPGALMLVGEHERPLSITGGCG
jgi:hypothetical protein